MGNIEKGKPLQCVEKNTGHNLQGILILSDKESSVELYDFENFLYIKEDQPIYLVVQTGHFASLHSNVQISFGTTSSHERKIYHQAFHSNVAIVGYDKWTETDNVKTVSFKVNHILNLFRHRDKVKGLGNSKLPAYEHFKIFEETAKSMTFIAEYGATYGMDFDSPIELWPTFTIEFDEPQSIYDYITHVSNYVNFLSFCFGVRLVPHDIHINKLSRTEIMKNIDEHTYLGDYEVHYIWTESKFDSRDLWVGGSPVCAWDDKELSALCSCLVAWMDRVDMWNKSYTMMMYSFNLKENISSERIINANRWFQEVPIASAKNAISLKDIRAISTAATNTAKELGYTPAIQERIASAIKRVKEESAKEHFTRLVEMIEKRFGKDIFPKNAVSHLSQAISFRGRAAHGHLNLEDDSKFREFNKSILAMEALCYLLTALELPISEEGVKRIRNNPLVRDYHNAHE